MFQIIIVRYIRKLLYTNTVNRMTITEKSFNHEWNMNVTLILRSNSMEYLYQLVSILQYLISHLTFTLAWWAGQGPYLLPAAPAQVNNWRELLLLLFFFFFLLGRS